MILGQGPAHTDKDLLAEYDRFLVKNNDVLNPTILQRLQDAPRAMRRRIGQPILRWSDAEVLALYTGRSKTVRYAYSAFLAFLFFRGYRRASVELLLSFSLGLTRYHRKALAPLREKLEKTRQELGYGKGGVGSELNLLIALLAVAQKPLKRVTRADFDAFRDAYQTRYRALRRRTGGKPDARLTRLEYYLVHWGVIPPARVVFRHEEHFASLQSTPVQAAILAFLAWAEVKYQPSTIHSRRAALLNFFVWFQAQYPARAGLADVTRPVALAFAKHLRQLREAGQYAQIYCNDQYRSLRLFYEFAIQERLETSPDRNPFALHDLPREPDPVPRYLTDQEVQAVLTYCEHQASLKERTLVLILLHTGIRAAELAALQTTDLVQIQGRWKLHIHEGKGLKDRLIPLTPECRAALEAWQASGWERVGARLFTRYGRPWQSATVGSLIREVGLKAGVTRLTAHRFRHTFAVALLNYGMRESALQKVMGHATLNMTLEYARILDQTVEQSFAAAVEQMQQGPTRWMPSFFTLEDYTALAEGDAVNWIRLPLGYCRRNVQLHCESDVKCLLCERFVASAEDLPRLRDMQDRFVALGMPVKATVVAAQLERLQAPPDRCFIPASQLQGLNDYQPAQTVAAA